MPQSFNEAPANSPGIGRLLGCWTPSIPSPRSFNEAPANSPGIGCSPRSPKEPPMDFASMRPRRIRRGSACIASLLGVRGHREASMRPRRIRRGSELEPEALLSVRNAGFNEAPANSPGIGRTRLRRPATFDERRFNEAPANSPGIGHGGQCCQTCRLAGASMRPRRIRRGSACPRLLPAELSQFRS